MRKLQEFNHFADDAIAEVLPPQGPLKIRITCWSGLTWQLSQASVDRQVIRLPKRHDDQEYGSACCNCFDVIHGCITAGSTI